MMLLTEIIGHQHLKVVIKVNRHQQLYPTFVSNIDLALITKNRLTKRELKFS